MKIGVLAAQGAFIEHVHMLHMLHVDTVQVRLPADMKNIDGLIIPGGESTTISQLMTDYELFHEIKKRAAKGLPVFGTCAGMILIAKQISDANGVEGLGLMDITVRRNAFGRQLHSFEADLNIPVLGKKPFPGIFIRAPLIENVHSGEVLARLDDGRIVAARQEKLLAAAFHPELTGDTRFHQYFLDIINNN